MSGWRWRFEIGTTEQPLRTAATGQQGADTLCAFLRTIGSRLGKPVLMTPEGGSQEHPVLGYDPALGKVTSR